MFAMVYQSKIYGNFSTNRTRLQIVLLLIQSTSRTNQQITHKDRSRGIAEMLVKRRLSVLKELFEEYRMCVTATWVDSQEAG